MKKKQLPLLLAIIVYTAAGLIACSAFLVVGTFRTSEQSIAPAPLYQIAPQLSAASEETGSTDSMETTAEPQAEAPVPSMPSIEETAKPAKETEAPAANVFYAFTAVHRKGRLNVRVSADTNAPIVGRLTSGAEGLVLEKGTEWSLIQTGDITGYVYNQYLEFHEIPEEEYHPN